MNDHHHWIYYRILAKKLGIPVNVSPVFLSDSISYQNKKRFEMSSVLDVLTLCFRRRNRLLSKLIRLQFWKITSSREWHPHTKILIVDFFFFFSFYIRFQQYPNLTDLLKQNTPMLLGRYILKYLTNSGILKKHEKYIFFISSRCILTSALVSNYSVIVSLK